MTFIRRFLYHSAGALHKFVLLLLPLVFGVAVLLSSPTYIEKALKESRVYDQFVSTVIDNSQKESTDPDSKEILSQPEIKAAAEKSFTPALLQSSTESVFNGVFAWIQGKTTEPEFRIDLTNAKADLSKNVAAYAEKRANSLPPCTLEQLRQMSPDIDLLQIQCLPPGINVSALAQEYSQKFLNDGDFLKDPVITNETIAENNDGKPLSEQLSGAPKAYSALHLTKWILLALALALTALLIFARRDRRAGLRHVAWSLIGVATFLIIMLIIYWFVFDNANASRAAADAVQAMWVDGAQSLARQFNKVVLWFSAGYLVIGGGLLLFLRLRPNRTIKRTPGETEPQAAVLNTNEEKANPSETEQQSNDK
jgi:hypothetical protein